MKDLDEAHFGVLIYDLLMLCRKCKAPYEQGVKALRQAADALEKAIGERGKK